MPALMPRIMLKLEYYREKKSYAVSKKWIQKQLETMMEKFPRSVDIPLVGSFHPRKRYSLSVAIVADRSIHKINKNFRGKDQVTDVISIEGDRDEFVQNDELPFDLGEVIICYPQTQRQAKEHGVSVRVEFQKLLIHGFLHALGYDHVKDKDWKIMEPLEQKMKSILEHEPRFEQHVNIGYN